MIIIRIRKFLFNRRNQRFGGAGMKLAEKGFVNRTMGAPGAYQIFAKILSVNEKSVVFADNFLGFVSYDLCTAALQQPMIKFNPANGMLIAVDGKSQAFQVDDQSIEYGSITGVFIRADFQPVENARGQPSGAWLDAGKGPFFQNQRIDSVTVEFKGTGGACRSSADDNDFGCNGVHAGPQMIIMAVQTKRQSG